jgi:hypothetical protein
MLYIQQSKAFVRKMFSRGDQCCQVAEISAKKLKRGRGKKSAGKVSGRILAEFYQKWQKRGQRIFSTKVPYFNGMDILSETKKNVNFIAN